jgi:hypothetical protein
LSGCGQILAELIQVESEHIYIINRNMETLIDGSKEVGLEVNG